MFSVEIFESYKSIAVALTSASSITSGALILPPVLCAVDEISIFLSILIFDAFILDPYKPHAKILMSTSTLLKPMIDVLLFRDATSIQSS